MYISLRIIKFVVGTVATWNQSVACPHPTDVKFKSLLAAWGGGGGVFIHQSAVDYVFLVWQLYLTQSLHNIISCGIKFFLSFSNLDTFDFFLIDKSVNIALKKPASQSSTRKQQDYASKAVDGNRNVNFNEGSCSHTAGGRNYPWWKVDLFSIGAVSRVYVVNRNDQYYHSLSNFELRIGELYSVLSHFCDSVPLCDTCCPL